MKAPIKLGHIPKTLDRFEIREPTYQCAEHPLELTKGHLWLDDGTGKRAVYFGKIELFRTGFELAIDSNLKNNLMHLWGVWRETCIEAICSDLENVSRAGCASDLMQEIVEIFEHYNERASAK